MIPSETLLWPCSVEDAPTKDLLTSQFFMPDEIRQLLVHCRTLGSRLGLQTAAMVTMGMYGGLRCEPLQHVITYGASLCMLGWGAVMSTRCRALQV